MRNKKTGPRSADRFFAKLSFKSLETNLALPPENMRSAMRSTAK